MGKVLRDFGKKSFFVDKMVHLEDNFKRVVYFIFIYLPSLILQTFSKKFLNSAPPLKNKVYLYFQNIFLIILSSSFVCFMRDSTRSLQKKLQLLVALLHTSCRSETSNISSVLLDIVQEKFVIILSVDLI